MKFLLPVCFLVATLLGRFAQAASVTLYPSDDAFVAEFSPDSNFDAFDRLGIGGAT